VSRAVRYAVTAHGGAPGYARRTGRSPPREHFGDVQVVVAASDGTDADLVVARTEDVSAVDARTHEGAVDRTRRASTSNVFTERAPPADLVRQVRVVVDATVACHVAAVSFRDGVQIGSRREPAHASARTFAVRER